MSRLVTAYVSAGANTGSKQVDAFETSLSSLYERGREAHPTLSVADEEFVAHLARCGAAVDGRQEPIHAEDLFLVCACLRGDEEALAVMVANYKQLLVTTVGHIDPSHAFVDDAQQRFWDAAIVGSVSAPPRLSMYSGRGSLAGWIAVSAQRIALMMRRHDKAEGRAHLLAGDVSDAIEDPELAFIKERYRDHFRIATARALEKLDDRERMIFRLHLADGVTIERIGRVYGVSHSTISRWFVTAREKVVSEVQRIICEELQIAPADFESVKRLVLSQLDFSISKLPLPRT